HNWHLEVLTSHLEAISRGELQDLLINVPPGFMKSLTVSVFWPAWEWTWLPWTRWLFTSYDGQLSIRDALKTRRLIESEWYQQRWGHVFKLTSDQNQKTRFENNRTGWRIASSINGLATGEHAHRRVADDPHKVRQRDGELLWPAMVDQAETNALKTTKLGPYAYAGQYQQRPTPRAGMVLDPAQIGDLPHLQAATVDILMAWDLNYSSKDASD